MIMFEPEAPLSAAHTAYFVIECVLLHHKQNFQVLLMLCMETYDCNMTQPGISQIHTGLTILD